MDRHGSRASPNTLPSPRFSGDLEDVDAILVDESRRSRAGKLDKLPGEWRSAPRRWGHPLHSLCSYFAMTSCTDRGERAASSRAVAPMSVVR